MRNIISKKPRLYFIVLVFILLFSSCVRPPHYHKSLVEAVRKEGSDRTAGKIRQRDNRGDYFSSRGQSKAGSSKDLPYYSHVRVLLYEGDSFPKVYFRKKFIALDERDKKIFSGGPGYLQKYRSRINGFAHLFSNGKAVLKGIRFQGSFFVIKESGRWLFINELPVEEYLAGVLPHEMQADWPQEALRAQAIVSRTFAYYHIERKKKKPYQLRATVKSQVFRGMEKVNAKVTEAVKSTSGQVILYEGKIIQSFFHASSGGVTELGDNVWQSGRYPYTQTRKVDYGKSFPSYDWEYSMDTLDFLAFIKKKYSFDRVKSFRISKRSESGRAISFQILGYKNENLVNQRIKANNFRIHFGARKIKSLLFQMKSGNNGKIVFSGKGYGHGVGMCQWGAFDMAKAGMQAEDIIRYFYKNISIVRTRLNKPLLLSQK